MDYFLRRICGKSCFFGSQWRSRVFIDNDKSKQHCKAEAPIIPLEEAKRRIHGKPVLLGTVDPKVELEMRDMLSDSGATQISDLSQNYVRLRNWCNMKIIYDNNCWFTNVGEAFIDIGALQLIKNVFPQASIGCGGNMTHFYVNNSIKGSGQELKQKGFLPRFLPQEYYAADCLILAGMFISKTMFSNGNTVRYVEKFVQDGSRLVFLGLGGETYDKEEADLFRAWMEKVKPALIMTRDTQTYEMLKNVCPCVNGIDCAFWVNEAFDPRGFVKHDYDIVSFNRTKEPEIFSQKWERDIVRPWHFPFSFRAEHIQEGVLVSDTPYDYLTAYANSRMVYTDLVHATIISLTYGVPVKYYFVDKRSGAFYSLHELENRDGILTIPSAKLEAKKRDLEAKILHVFSNSH